MCPAKKEIWCGSTVGTEAPSTDEAKPVATPETGEQGSTKLPSWGFGLIIAIIILILVALIIAIIFLDRNRRKYEKMAAMKKANALKKTSTIQKTGARPSYVRMFASDEHQGPGIDEQVAVSLDLGPEMIQRPSDKKIYLKHSASKTASESSTKSISGSAKQMK